jgi:hypothetical protein
MDVEQPSLGSVGVDAAHIALSWAWDSDWTLKATWRRSGSLHWQESSYPHLSSEEVAQVAYDVLEGLTGPF